MRRVFTMVATAALMVLMLAPVASASPPERLSFSWQSTFVLGAGEFCPFEVTFTTEQDWHGINRYDAEANPLGFEFWARGVDTLSAGNTLVSEPYTYHIAGVDADGPQLKNGTMGVTEKIRLPDGSWYIAAGWFTFLDKDPLVFYLNPDRGSLGDVEALCAALE